MGPSLTWSGLQKNRLLKQKPKVPHQETVGQIECILDAQKVPVAKQSVSFVCPFFFPMLQISASVMQK